MKGRSHGPSEYSVNVHFLPSFPFTQCGDPCATTSILNAFINKVPFTRKVFLKCIKVIPLSEPEAF